MDDCSSLVSDRAILERGEGVGGALGGKSRDVSVIIWDFVTRYTRIVFDAIPGSLSSWRLLLCSLWRIA